MSKGYTCGECKEQRSDSRSHWCQRIDNVICTDCCAKSAAEGGECEGCKHAPKTVKLLTFDEKVTLLKAVDAKNVSMYSSLELCLKDAMDLHSQEKFESAEIRLNKAAQYAWGFWRPEGWKAPEKPSVGAEA